MPTASPQKWWIVRRSAIHQRGIFSRTFIPSGTPIIEYTGEKITKAESERRGNALAARAAKTGGAAVYIFTLNKTHDLDGSTSGNTARLINHSCEPNCEAFISRGRIWIHAKHDIPEGEELSFNYGFALDTWEDHPCRCGKPSCIGYIVDEQYWPKLRRILKARAQRAEKIAALEARAAELQQQLDELGEPTPPATKVAQKKTAKAAKKKLAARQK